VKPVVQTGSALWREIREDFERLPSADWRLIWSSRPPFTLSGEQLESQWTWHHPTDLGLRARASAIFLKAAKARGYATEDGWLDDLRNADFAHFEITGHGFDTIPADGSTVESTWGTLRDAVTHSITLCYQLEAESAPAAARRTLGAAPKPEPEEANADEAAAQGGKIENPRIKSRKPGPKPGYETARRAAEIVQRIAPDGDVNEMLLDVCEELDRAAIPCPKTWPNRQLALRSWQEAALLERQVAKKAIRDRLKLAKVKTLS
jgi:hypothetical protein